MASGTQYISWLHEKDFGEIVQFLMENEGLHGIFNVTGPKPVRNDTFMKVLAKQVGSILRLGAPKWMLEIGARIIGTETELILKSRYVIPRRLNEVGYKFRFPTIETAFKDLLH